MNAQRLKKILQNFGFALGLVGIGLIIFVVFVSVGYVPVLQNKSDYLILAPMGAYFIFLAVALYLCFSPSLVHQLVSVFTVFAGLAIVFCIMEHGFGGRLLRAAVAIFCFLAVAAIHKMILGWIGRVLFSKEIIER
jgi:predicted anti-sigma-YlaC factor YlaD